MMLAYPNQKMLPALYWHCRRVESGETQTMKSIVWQYWGSISEHRASSCRPFHTDVGFCACVRLWLRTVQRPVPSKRTQLANKGKLWVGLCIVKQTVHTLSMSLSDLCGGFSYSTSYTMYTGLFALLFCRTCSLFTQNSLICLWFVLTKIMFPYPFFSFFHVLFLCSSPRTKVGRGIELWNRDTMMAYREDPFLDSSGTGDCHCHYSTALGLILGLDLNHTFPQMQSQLNVLVISCNSQSQSVHKSACPNIITWRNRVSIEYLRR